jgi:hypothetical protein
MPITVHDVDPQVRISKGRFGQLSKQRYIRLRYLRARQAVGEGFKVLGIVVLPNTVLTKRNISIVGVERGKVLHKQTFG